MTKRPLSIAVVVLAGALTGCGDGASSQNDAGPTNFECTTERDGWQQCVDNKVQYCHIVSGMDPHFHWGADCQSLGFTCIEASQNVAGCLDQASICTVGASKCEDNTAYNCLDHDGQGHWAIEPCGTAATCKQEGTKALCDHAPVTFDPQDACDAMTATAVEEKAVVTTFGDVFAPNYHAELGIRVHVTLPDNQVSYIHFPVFSCGEFAVFANRTGVLDGIQHRNESEMTLSGGTAVGLCSADIPEHWHADLEWDGDGTEGTDPVPYVIRFKAVAGGGEVNFAVFQIAAED
jgi:hypothetical protein